VPPSAGPSWRRGLCGSDPATLGILGAAFVIDGIEEHIPNLHRDDVVARQLLQPHPIGLQIDEIPLLVLLLGHGVEFDPPG
jgi:hypothetical protein